MFLKIGVKKLGFESAKGFDFLNSENAKRSCSAGVCGKVFLNNVRGVRSKIYFSYT